MPVDKQWQCWVSLSEESRHIIVKIVDLVVYHAEASSEPKTAQIDQMHVKTIQCVLNRTFQVNIRILCETMNNRYCRTHTTVFNR